VERIQSARGYRNENDMLSPRSATDTILQGTARRAYVTKFAIRPHAFVPSC
jgi:hypothetical protein